MKFVVLFHNNLLFINSIMKSFSEAIKSLGNEVAELSIPNGYDNKTLDFLKDFNPDYLIAYGIGGLSKLNDRFILRDLNIPLISLFYDCPLVAFTDEIEREMKSFPEFYMNFIWDDYFIELFNSKEIKNTYKILLATDPRIFSKNKSINESNDISFIGGVNNDFLNSNTNSIIVNQFIDEVIKLKTEEINTPILNLCFRLFKCEKYREILSIWTNENYLFWKIIYFIISAKGSVVLRKDILSNINNKVHMYGSQNWRHLNIINYEDVSYENLSNLYQRYKINLNISSLQLETSLNNRLFDVFASEAFLLTDYKSDLEKIVPQYIDKITYQNVEDLNSKIEYYLVNENERKEITSEIKNIVLCNHTYMDRAKQIINTINNNKTILKKFYN